MSVKSKLLKVMFCLALGFASAGGALMRPEEIEELMSAMNRPKGAHQLPEDREAGDDLIRKIRGQMAR